MNDTNSYMFDIQSIIFDYIKTVPLILNCFQHLKNERYFFVTNGRNIFSRLIRSVYKELHADRETGC